MRARVSATLVACTLVFAGACHDRGGLSGAGGGGAQLGGSGVGGGHAGGAGGGSSAGGSGPGGASPGGQSGASGGHGGTAGGPGGTASGGAGAPGPLSNKVDLLFMVDNSSSMAPLQTKLSAQLPTFLNLLKDSTTGKYPDLHVAVVSSSFGGGAWGNVNQCGSGMHPGDDQGYFQQGPGGAGAGNCFMLHSGETFLKNGDGTSVNPANFDGDIGTAFQCMALLGDTGCGFEAPFESVYYALYRGYLSPGDVSQDGDGLHDSHNGGFLRDDAVLGVVMLTNEDDCSVASNSLLLDPGVDRATDPTGLGALQSYRCNEFGHLCDGQPPPHGYDFTSNQFNLASGTYRTPTGPGTGGVLLNNCVSEEGMGKTDPLLRDPDGTSDPTNGHLWPKVSDLTQFILELKTNPDDILVAALAGPVVDGNGSSLYRVFAQVNPAAGSELDPVVDHSCTQATTDANRPEYADPAVRIHQWTDSFGANGVFYPICANDFSAAMTGIANKLHQKIGPARALLSAPVRIRDQR